MREVGLNSRERGTRPPSLALVGTVGTAGTVPEGAFWPLRHAVAERRFFARLRLLGDVSSRREAVVLDRTRGRDGWRSADVLRLILREAIGVRPLHVARGYTGGSLYFNIYVR